ncbi:prepilin-type N-terminal cleavage/methylation domain-containing protein [Guyparkeria halophila]|uniref:Prepilin-type N-terminal cleavage/methylation domain-containing protein n=1 Tax=Guyparkeria halophila TaxID=47960 RepID=A0A6I6CZP9_9GAMM|nr:type IV pilin protein [Guyparkeria halophila]QGT77485.1 prepilin-type N-terminal cleavage/methylation domain-containing protein [Guyparkeria halophila]
MKQPTLKACRKGNHGFTLVELMIVVVIVAILASIALPSFLEQINKTRRADGTSKLLEIMQAQERYRTTEFTYTTDLTELGYTVDGDGDATSDEGYYSIAASACGDGIATCVQLTATPQNAQQDDACGTLSLDSTGLRTKSGSPPIEDCW